MASQTAWPGGWPRAGAPPSGVRTTMRWQSKSLRCSRRAPQNFNRNEVPKMDIKNIETAMAERDKALLGRLDSIDKLLADHSAKWDAREDDEARAGQPGKTAHEEA